MKNKSVCCVGLGNMGGAIVGSLAALGYLDIFGFHPDPAKCKERCEKLQIAVVTDWKEVCQKDIVLLAVKPHQLQKLLSILQPFLSAKTTLISVAAGVTLARLHEWSCGVSPLCRVMPNTPALVQRGAIALAWGEFAPDEETQAFVQKMFAATGNVYVLEEKYFDVFGALIGAGPAYVFAFMEALIDACVNQGLPRSQVTSMVSDLLDGSIALQRMSGEHITVLKEMVTSPGGVTIAGLNQFDKHAFRYAVIDGVNAAVERGKKLV